MNIHKALVTANSSICLL